MATQTTQIAYPPIDSQATYTFIDAQVDAANQTGDLNTDFKLALYNALAFTDGVSKYSIDDLWKRYVEVTVAADTANVNSNAPVTRTHPTTGRPVTGGQHPKHNYSQTFLSNPGNANAFPGGGDPQPSWANVKFVFRGNGTNGDNADWSGEYYAPVSLKLVEYLGTSVQLSNAQTRAGMATSLACNISADNADRVEIDVTKQADRTTFFPSGAGSEFTIECWAYATDTDAAVPLAGLFGSIGARSWAFREGNTAGHNQAGADLNFDGATGDIVLNSVTGTGASNYSQDEWVHHCVQRVGNEVYFYINGVIDDQITVLAGETMQDTDATNAGAIGIGSIQASVQEFVGYIDSLRVIEGEAIYTEAGFTPPTDAFPIENPEVGADPLWDNVTCVMRGNGADADSDAGDSEYYCANGVTTTAFNSSAQLDDAQTRAGMTTSLNIPTTNDWMRLTPVEPSDCFIDDANDFTIEGWVRHANIVQGALIFAWMPNELDRRGWEIRNHLTSGSDPEYQFLIYEDDQTPHLIGPNTKAAELNEWVHLCLERDGNTVTAYVDGGSHASFDCTGMTFGAVNQNLGLGLYFGKGERGSSSMNNGWIDSFRITKGVARYGGTFTPPTTAFPINDAS